MFLRHTVQMDGLDSAIALNVVEPAQDHPALSGREMEILTWIALGKSNSIIADILGISAHTVDTHIRRILGKLGVSSRTTAAVRAAQQGILPPV